MVAAQPRPAASAVVVVASKSRVFAQMPEDIPTLDARVAQIRNLVNDHRRQAELAREPRRWNQLCSCMDAISSASCTYR